MPIAGWRPSFPCSFQHLCKQQGLRLGTRDKHAGYQQGSASPIWPIYTDVCEKTSPLQNFIVLSLTTFLPVFVFWFVVESARRAAEHEQPHLVYAGQEMLPSM